MAKKIGILGGMSPESTITYYEYITRSYTERFGNYGYPEIVIYSVSFQPFIDWPSQGKWDLVTLKLVEAAHRLEDAGADFIIIATNTMHIVFDDIQAQVNIPILSLLDAVGEAITNKGLQKAGLLGTRFTMQNSFYADALEKYGIEVIVPQSEDAAIIDGIIYSELVKGVIRSESKQQYLQISQKLEKRGAQGIILGCTEIPLLIKPEDTGLLLFDTTTIHAEAALQYSLQIA